MARRFTGFVLSGLCLTSVAVSACSKREASDPRTSPPRVRIAVVSAANAGEREFTGVVAARVQSDLGFRVPGKIIQRLVDTGQAVKRGDALMRIDRTDYVLATAALTSTVEAARARSIQASADEARYRDLVSAGAISALTYDQAKAVADAATAQLAAARAQVRVSEHEQGYSLLRADADGVVVQTLAEPGQVVSAGQTVVRLAHAGPREANVSLPETLRPSLGSTVQAAVFGTGEVVAAKLRQLSHAADPQTRTFEARYVLGGSAADAPLGATVTIRIPDGQTASLRVPLSALFDNGRGPGVWLVDKQVLHWHAVTLGSMSAESVSVIAGLQTGDAYVAMGAPQLHEGQTIRPAAIEQAAL